jgi:uncharacterized protein YigA (DUF484 family)
MANLGADPRVDDDDIRDFLVQNPDYFQRHPELLSLLHIPHASGSAVSLVERQVSVLRERNVDLRHRLRDLGSTARDNDQLFSDTRRLVLALLEADDATGIERALLKVLRDDFDIEYASLTLFEEHFDSVDGLRCVPQQQLLGHLGSVLGRGSAGCGALRADAFAFLFPGARLIGSVAVALIERDGERLGAVAVGNSDAAHYSDAMGTLFLEFVAEVLARLLGRSGPS